MEEKCLSLKLSPALKSWLNSLTDEQRKKLLEYDKKVAQVHIDLIKKFEMEKSEEETRRYRKS
jgi:hypothetical protein